MLLRAVADLIESGDVLADLVRNARSDVSDEARAALDDWEVKSNAFD